MQSTKTYVRFLRATAALLVCMLTLEGVFFYSEYEDIHRSFLRLHVVAASDTQEDQRIKLAVRDAVLAAGADIFNGSVTAADAEEKILPQISSIQYAAQQVLAANNRDDTVSVSVGREYFPEKQYDSIILPPGIYKAVKITIGAGKGHNWWCVMFPPMCLPAAEKADPADEMTRQETDMITEPEKYRIRFKTAELYRKLIAKIQEKAEQKNTDGD